MSKEIVHVHDLAPALSVTDFTLILQVSNHFCFAGQRPNETTAVGRRVLFGWADADIDLMHGGGGLVHDVAQQLDESVSHHFFVIIIAQLKSVIEKDVGLVLVIIRINNL